MFKFGFGESNTEKDEKNNTNANELDWFPVCQIDATEKQIDHLSNEEFVEKEVFPNVSLKLIQPDIVIGKLKADDEKYVLEAESQHSDLLPSKYEGGMKIWECTYDLGNYILQENYELKDKLVLDLGCGAGVIGLLTLKNGAKVHFQDYNSEVIHHITIPNVKLNDENALQKCQFYSGDWKSFTDFLNDKSLTEDDKYDFIFTSETIYNPDNYEKLFNVFKCRLKESGIGLVAAKTHYFGVGGGMRQFEELVKKDQNFNTEIVWSSETGLQREILKLTKVQIS